MKITVQVPSASPFKATSLELLTAAPKRFTHHHWMIFVRSALVLLFTVVEVISATPWVISATPWEICATHDVCDVIERSIRCVSPDGCSREWQHDPYMSTDAKIDVIRM